MDTLAGRRPPGSVCTVCGKYSSGESINYRCTARTSDGACRGIFGSAISNNDWAPCTDCGQTGCQTCQQSGWVYLRR